MKLREKDGNKSIYIAILESRVPASQHLYNYIMAFFPSPPCCLGVATSQNSFQTGKIEC